MRGAVLHTSPGELVVESLTVDKPNPNEVLISTSHAGLCHSDLHFMDGHWPVAESMVMGHESAGVVAAVGEDVTYVKPGDHVITCVSMWCGVCRTCLQGKPYLCLDADSMRSGRPTPSLRFDDGRGCIAFAGLGSFAEELLVHERAVVKIRDEMPLDRAALIGCGVTTGLGAVMRTAAVPAGSSVVVIGCGGIGLSAVQGARIVGATPIIAVDLVASKLEMARTLGATHTVNASETDPVAAVHEITGGGADYSFEAIGLSATAEQAWAMIGIGGTATVIGMLPMTSQVTIPGGEIILSEKKLQGSLMGGNRFRLDMPKFIDLYLDGRLKLDEMVSATIGIDEVNDGYSAMKAGETLRSVIAF
ncbi:MAG: Zn-dependent alcohol dehydrogenase [Acidimicrobiia bacterium]|nr:Zn-dependent alcohol dehydrogenase [Acidimicrobiia bacterium]MYG59029.1 Zn-dependent alcohol dehydrogenase [Acidimicrobiia bacterium]MYJ33163.1 Zn-dependent alcohol dehydrogenase [Acidimicrobiia bacterium]